MQDFVPDFSSYLNTLIKYLKTTLGIQISVYIYSDALVDHCGLRFDPVMEANHTCRYCRAMQDVEDKRLCIAVEAEEDVAAAMTQREPFLRKCFAGVTEALVPFFYNGKLAAIIKLGQCREQTDAVPADILRRFPAGSKVSTEVQAYYGELPAVDSQTLLSAANLVDHALKVLAWDSVVPDNTDSERNVTAENAKTLIDTYIIEPDFSIPKIAAQLNVTPEHLCRMFIRKYKVSIIEYLTQMRLKRAKFLLVNTNFSIQKVAERCGFHDPSYFCRVFKKNFNLTPGQYRKNAKNV